MIKSGQSVLSSYLFNKEAFSPQGSDIALAEWDAPGTPLGQTPVMIAPLHRHLHDDEAWYILEGALGFRAGNETFEATAGQAVVIPKGTPHTFWNPHASTARYLLIMTNRIYHLINELHAPGRTESIEELFLKYESELLE